MVGLLLFGFASLLAVLVYTSTTFANVLLFKPNLITQLGSVITTLSFLALAVQSTIEIVVSVVREPEKIELEEKILELKSLPDNAENQLQLKQKSLEILSFQNKTRNLVYGLSFTFGTLIALAGFRLLQSLTETSPLSGIQLRLFIAVDVFLSAVLISGGTEGIHRLTKLYELYTKPPTNGK